MAQCSAMRASLRPGKATHAWQRVTRRHGGGLDGLQAAGSEAFIIEALRLVCRRKTWYKQRVAAGRWRRARRRMPRRQAVG